MENGVVGFVEQELGKTGLTFDTTFDSLGLESLDFLDLIQQFEQQFSVRIPDADLVKLSKIGDLSGYLSN